MFAFSSFMILVFVVMAGIVVSIGIKMVFPEGIVTFFRQGFCKHDFHFDHQYTGHTNIGNISSSGTYIVYKCRKCTKPVETK